MRVQRAESETTAPLALDYFTDYAMRERTEMFGAPPAGGGGHPTGDSSPVELVPV